MNTKENAVTDISLKEIFAVILRGGKQIILFAMIFAVLFGAFGAMEYYTSDESVQAEYQIALEEYKMEKERLQSAVERAERDAANQKAYNENSQLMKLDPYNKITTTMVFAISGIDLEEIADPFQITQLPISDVTTRIQAQYLALWNGLNLEKLLADTGYSGVADKYLREVIALNPSDGGVLTLIVAGNDAADCEQIVGKLYDALLVSSETVAKASYDHTFTLLSNAITTSCIDLKLEQAQLENANKQEKYNVSLEEAEKALQECKAPTYGKSASGIVVNVIVGAVIGVLVTVLFLVCAHIIRGKVSGAKQLTARYGLIHFGSLAKKIGFWERLGYAMMGEKLWKDEAQAQAYIRESCQNHLPEGAAVAVVSSLDTVDEAIKARMVELLSARGHKVSFVTDVAHNPDALAAIAQSSGVVLAERVFVSANAEVKDLLKTVHEFNKPVYGFLLV